jgi:FAD/FMN-containing dehydrogenase
MKQQQNYVLKIGQKMFKASVAANFFQPETEEEIITVVKNYPKIRMVGTGHSWSGICATNEALLNLDNYNKILKLIKR